MLVKVIDDEVGMRMTARLPIGIAARFDTAHDVTLDEIRIELLYPLDEVAERFFAAGTTSAPAGSP